MEIFTLTLSGFLHKQHVFWFTEMRTFSSHFYMLASFFAFFTQLYRQKDSEANKKEFLPAKNGTNWLSVKQK